MTGATVETSPQLYARMAGVSYLLGSVTSVAGQMVVRGMLVVFADGAATAANILAHESLLRLGFASSFMAVPFHIAWAILFYELFKPVNRSLSLLAAFVMLMGCTMWVLSCLFPLSPSLVLQRRERLERICTRTVAGSRPGASENERPGLRRRVGVLWILVCPHWLCHFQVNLPTSDYWRV